MIRKLFAFGLAVVLALMPVQAFGKTVSRQWKPCATIWRY